MTALWLWLFFVQERTSLLPPWTSSSSPKGVKSNETIIFCLSLICSWGWYISPWVFSIICQITTLLIYQRLWTKVCQYSYLVWFWADNSACFSGTLRPWAPSPVSLHFVPSERNGQPPHDLCLKVSVLILCALDRAGVEFTLGSMIWCIWVCVCECVSSVCYWSLDSTTHKQSMIDSSMQMWFTLNCLYTDFERIRPNKISM
jgi:hypothetical protein